jgi:hypothetical protein
LTFLSVSDIIEDVTTAPTLTKNVKPLPPLPPTRRATISIGNYPEREARQSELLPCEREDA